MLTYALDITAMAQTWLRAVICVGLHARDLIVGRVAVGKAVGHEHVEHVGVGEAFALLTALFTGE